MRKDGSQGPRSGSLAADRLKATTNTHPTYTYTRSHSHTHIHISRPKFVVEKCLDVLCFWYEAFVINLIKFIKCAHVSRIRSVVQLVTMIDDSHCCCSCCCFLGNNNDKLFTSVSQVVITVSLRVPELFVIYENRTLIRTVSQA